MPADDAMNPTGFLLNNPCEVTHADARAIHGVSLSASSRSRTSARLTFIPDDDRAVEDSDISRHLNNTTYPSSSIPCSAGT